jgi:short-subunit dehydrogenase
MNKAAIIIGVGPGLGYALAETFGRQGLHVAMVARSENNLKDFQQKLQAQDISASAHPVDVADFTAMRLTLAQIARAHPVAVLIYNVVVKQMIPPLELDVELMVKNYRIDVAGALHAVQIVLPFMQEQEAGTILFTGGGAALNPWTQAPTITIAKASIRSLAFMLAEQLEKSPVRVGTVTIYGNIRPDTAFSPERIAAAYYQYYEQGVPTVELSYKG